MKAKLCLLLLLVLVSTSWTVPDIAQSSPAQTSPITIRGRLYSNPQTLDPALATDSTSINVVGQLFVGLTSWDDHTGAVLPELATGWEISADRTVYTFTLRTDAFWSDGRPITAYDVEYGVLRSLNPLLGGSYGYILYIIEGATEYNWGDDPDPSHVGVEAIDLDTVRFRLAEPATYFPAIVSMWCAFPQPQWAIETWGTSWTDPGHIVTSGPYLLDEWVPDDYITLVKNPVFYGADGVQIEQLELPIITSSSEAFQMYQDGQLDTTAISVNELEEVSSDPVLSQELHVASYPCNYYYGFVTPKPPVDDPLVRQALSASIDRSGLISDVLQGGQFPASSFVPPGTFGSAAGEAGVGFNYEPDLARDLMAQAGYTDGVGFPTITLAFNTSTGHQAIAEFVAATWQRELSITVELSHTEWAEYLSWISPFTPLEQAPHVFRMGWCQDYADAHNWLYQVFHTEHSANRVRLDPSDPLVAQFDNLLDQAAQQTSDPDLRHSLYRQAEGLLNKDIAASAPIYYYSNLYLTKPFLHRTYSSMYPHHAARWRVLGSDLTVASKRLWNEAITPYEGDTVIVGANVHNTGGVPLDNVEVAFYDGDPATGGTLISDTLTIPSIPARGMAVASPGPAWAPSEGLHQLYAVVDPNGLIPELTGGNNIAMKAVAVMTPSLDMVAPNGTLAVASGAISTTRRAVNLTFAASDDSGTVAQLFVRELVPEPTTGEWLVGQESGWVPYTTAMTWMLLPGGGAKVLLAWFADGTGNVSGAARALIHYQPEVAEIATAAWDLYLWPLEAGQERSLNLTVKALTGDADLYVWQPGNDGAPDWSSHHPTQTTEIVTFTAPVSGFYQVQVHGYEETKYSLNVYPWVTGGEWGAGEIQQKEVPTSPLFLSNPADGASPVGDPPTPLDLVPPRLVTTRPSSGSLVPSGGEIFLGFSEVMNPLTLLYQCEPDPGGWGEEWRQGNTEVVLRHNAFQPGEHYTFTVSAGVDPAQNSLAGAPYVWSFEVGWHIFLPLVLNSY